MFSHFLERNPFDNTHFDISHRREIVLSSKNFSILIHLFQLSTVPSIMRRKKKYSSIEFSPIINRRPINLSRMLPSSKEEGSQEQGWDGAQIGHPQSLTMSISNTSCDLSSLHVFHSCLFSGALFTLIVIRTWSAERGDPTANQSFSLSNKLFHNTSYSRRKLWKLSTNLHTKSSRNDHDRSVTNDPPTQKQTNSERTNGP